MAHSMVAEILRFAGRTATLRMAPSTSEDAFRNSLTHYPISGEWSANLALPD
ncbi:MAG: hypothetical protein WBD59_01010 [Candidatus Sulfotelmatobacter sp.]